MSIGPLPKRSEGGFTLIELLVVIAIIGILSATAITFFVGIRQHARDSKRVADMQNIHKALELFFLQNGHYPSPLYEGVSRNGEVIGDDEGPIEQALRPYISVMPRDPRHDLEADQSNLADAYFYSYDPDHCVSDSLSTCNCPGNTLGATLAANKIETDDVEVVKETCSGVQMNHHNADYVQVFHPLPPR